MSDRKKLARPIPRTPDYSVTCEHGVLLDVYCSQCPADNPVMYHRTTMNVSAGGAAPSREELVRTIIGALQPDDAFTALEIADAILAKWPGAGLPSEDTARLDWLGEEAASVAGAVMREEFTTIGERYDALEMVELRLVSGYADQSGDVQTGYGTALRHLRDFMRRLAPLRFDRDHDVNGHLRAFVGGLGGEVGLVETPSPPTPVIAATEDHPAVYRDGKRLTATPPNVIRKPTIEELEAILADEGQRNVELLPDGSVVVRRAGPTREQVEALRQWFMPDDELAIAYLDRDSVLALFASPSSTPGTDK